MSPARMPKSQHTVIATAIRQAVDQPDGRIERRQAELVEHYGIEPGELIGHSSPRAGASELPTADIA